jgi:hypothetical protein
MHCRRRRCQQPATKKPPEKGGFQVRKLASFPFGALAVP